MPIQPILRYPHPLLKKVCHAVDVIDDEIRGLVRDLLDTMRGGPGSVGVADLLEHRVGIEEDGLGRHGIRRRPP